jgi:hypothetical protein
MTFGLFEDHHHPRIPLDHLVESQARIDAHKLNLIGALTEGTMTELRWGERGYSLAARTVDILVSGNPLLVLWDELARPYFACPKCGRRCKHIYLDEFACRICCDLDYSSRHLHRSMSGVHRIRRWRRQLGIDPHPFAPIPERPKRHTRFHRIAARIRAEEGKLVGYLSGVNHDLKRRMQLRGMIPK